MRGNCPFSGPLGVDAVSPGSDLFDVIDRSNGLKVLGYGTFDRSTVGYIADAINYYRYEAHRFSGFELFLAGLIGAVLTAIPFCVWLKLEGVL